MIRILSSIVILLAATSALGADAPTAAAPKPAAAAPAPAAPEPAPSPAPGDAVLPKLAVHGADPGRTGATTDAGPERPPAIVWSQPVAANAVSDPNVVVVGERPIVLLGSGDDAIALEARSGEPIWSTRLDMLVTATPACVNGVAIIPGIEGLLRFADAATGKKIKDVENDYNLEAPGLLVGDLYIYEETSRAGGKSKSRLHALDLATRTDRWRSDFAGGTGRAPSTDGQRIFVASETAILAFGAADGSELWSHSFTPAARVYEPILHDGRLISARGGYGPGVVEALDAATGKSLWTQPTAARIGAAPSVGDAEIVVPLMNSTLARFKVADGAVLDPVKMPGRVDIRTVIAPNRIYFAAGKTVGALDRATMKTAWTLDMDGDAAVLTVTGASLLVARRDGFLHAVESPPPPAP